MWKKPWVWVLALAVSVANPAHAQMTDPFARLDLGVVPRCPLYCDPVTLLVGGDLTSTAWKVPVLTGSSRAGNKIAVAFDVEFNPGGTLPVLVPFAFQIPQGQLPSGPYEVQYTFWIINPIATMPSIPVNYYDTFLVAPPGDQNCDGKVSVMDIVHMIRQVFMGGPPPDPSYRADVNCDANTNILDIVYMICHVFRGGNICDYCASGGFSSYVVPTLTPPDSLKKHPVLLEYASVAGDTLTIRISYSGGCMVHSFAAYMSPPMFADSVPRQADVYPQHYDPGDPCDAWITQTLRFNLRPVADLYFIRYHRLDDIALNVYTGNPPGYQRVLYRPH